MDINGKPTVISTFCGTGGSSLGYHWAGFKELLAIDFDAHAVECFKLNFPDVPIWKRSVTDITGQEILDFCKIEVGELDVFDGSPPCQGFSTAGKRQVRDPRNDLFAHYYRLVMELQPKVFVMENVSGMAKGTMKGRFIEIMNVLKSGNYNVKCKQMNAMYYGVPQSRERLIFIGVRKDLTVLPMFPIPSKTLIPSGKVLKNIQPDICGPMTPLSLKLWNKMKPGNNGTVYRPGYYMSAIKLNPNRPSPTIPKTLSGCGGLFHWAERRKLGINELKLLCSFPETFKLTGTATDQHARLGNAVMPKFMQAIGETIKNEILFK